MKKDITTRTDIEELVKYFYQKVLADDLINKFFAHMDADHWQKHMKTMCDFWENAILFSGTYSGNPMASHALLHQRDNLSSQHFIRWLKLFDATVDEHFRGKNAELAKQRAIAIATTMQIKILK